MRFIFSCAARVPIISDVKGNHVRPLRCVNFFFKFDHLVLFCFFLFLMYFILLFYLLWSVSCPISIHEAVIIVLIVLSHFPRSTGKISVESLHYAIVCFCTERKWNNIKAQNQSIAKWHRSSLWRNLNKIRRIANNKWQIEYKSELSLMYWADIAKALPRSSQGFAAIFFSHIFPLKVLEP